MVPSQQDPLLLLPVAVDAHAEVAVFATELAVDVADANAVLKFQSEFTEAEIVSKTALDNSPRARASRLPCAADSADVSSQ